MKLLPVTPDSIKMGAQILRNGGLVAFPTETVYGLGADAYNPRALAKVFEAKKRPFFDPLIIHIAEINTLEKITNLRLLNNEIQKKLFILAENLWPGPFSVILPKNDKIPGIAAAGLQTIAVRFPDHDAAQKLISLSSGAVAAPSANPFGSLSPTRAEHVRDSLGDKVDMILDGGPARIGIESTVLEITGDCFRILRPGGTPKEAIDRLVGFTEEPGTQARESEKKKQLEENVNERFASPGQLKSHYAPKKPLFVLSREEIISLPYEEDSAFLFFDGSSRDVWHKEHAPPRGAVVKALSESGDMQEAASHFFETLHELDNSGVSKIYAQPAPQYGLGEAINDRLKRGSEGNKNI